MSLTWLFPLKKRREARMFELDCLSLRITCHKSASTLPVRGFGRCLNPMALSLVETLLPKAENLN